MSEPIRTELARDPAAIHLPVLVHEVLECLSPRAGGRYLDGTVGLGGHSRAILERTGGKAEILGLDRDRQALGLAAQRLSSCGDSVRLVHGRFSQFAEALEQVGWDSLDGVLLDLGLSSLQLDAPDRGFSFLADGPLDMRMDPSDGGPTAARLVNTLSVERLKHIIGRYGEEPLAARIARALVEARTREPIETTSRLADVVERAYPAKWRATARNHPATRTFQALRIEVNGELQELEDFLEAIGPRLRPGGRLAVISFHSLEDRAVKHFLRREAQGCLCPRAQMVCSCGHKAVFEILTRKPIVATPDEVASNARARSAKLRAAERLGGEAA